MAKRAKGDGSIRQRKDGKWEARYTVGRDPGTGKQIRKSIYGDTQNEVRKQLNQIVGDIDGGAYLEPSKLTVGEWLDIWLKDYVEDSVKPLTYNSYETQCRVHIKPNIGAVKLLKLNAHSIQAFYNKLFRGEGIKKPLSAKTIKNIHSVLHSGLKRAVKLGYIKYNPAESCTLPRVVKKEIKPLDEIQIAAFLKAVSGHKFEILYLFTLFSGMRQSEVLGLSWDNIDFENDIISIKRQLLKEKKKGGKYYIATLKNEKTRRIKAAKYVMQLLKQQNREQLKLIIDAGKLWINEHELVFTNEIGGNLIHGTVYKNFKRIAADLGIPDSRFHDLRHSYAVAALSSGDDIKNVQTNLGHHSAAFTLDVYGHVTERMKTESAERMDKYIKSVQNLA